MRNKIKKVFLFIISTRIPNNATSAEEYATWTGVEQHKKGAPTITTNANNKTNKTYATI